MVGMVFIKQIDFGKLNYRLHLKLIQASHSERREGKPGALVFYKS